jgi:hypothetical protein
LTFGIIADLSAHVEQADDRRSHDHPGSQRRGWARGRLLYNRGLLFPRAELAQPVLQMLNDIHSVPTLDAVQLRNWAVHPDAAVLPLDEIARRILSNERDPQDG